MENENDQKTWEDEVEQQQEDSGHESGAESPKVQHEKADDSDDEQTQKQQNRSSGIDDDDDKYIQKVDNYESSVAIPDDCIVHLETTQGTRLRPPFEAMAPLLVDGRIDFLKTGMVSRNADFKTTCIVDLVVDKAEHYICNREITVWLNFNRLVKVMRDLGEEDILCFQLTESSLNDNHLRVLHKAPKFSQLYRVVLRLPPDEIPHFSLTDFTFKVRVDIESVLLQKLTRTHEKNADYVRFAAYHSSDGENVLYVVIASSGDEALGTSIIPCQIGNGDSVFNVGEYVMKAEGKDASRGSLQSLRRLSLCAKATAASKYAALYLGGPDAPMAIRYETGTIGNITTFLAGQYDDVENGESEAHTQQQDILDEKEVRDWERVAREKKQKRKLQQETEQQTALTTFKRRKDGKTRTKIEKGGDSDDESEKPRKRKQQIEKVVEPTKRRKS